MAYSDPIVTRVEDANVPNGPSLSRATAVVIVGAARPDASDEVP